MRHLLFKLIILQLMLLSFYDIAFAQNNKLNIQQPKTIFSSTDPFKNDVFVKNEGQFDSWIKSFLPVKYVINSRDKIFFTQQGLFIKLEMPENKVEEEKEKDKKGAKGEENEFTYIETYWIKLNWIGCNSDAIMSTSEQTEGYYTFGEKGYEKLQAKGYKKLLYKDLYPRIDVEYIIPDKGGFKYSLILHPGADISKVKMQYTGDVEKIEKDIEGNIIIETPAGNVIDHSPVSYIKSTKQSMNSSFNFNKNYITFSLPKNKNNQTIIIDPWTITPTALTTNSEAEDIDYDDNGNVYVSGGSAPYKIAKYSSNGTYLWTYSLPNNWSSNGNGNYYSKFCVLRSSGSVFIGEGLSNPNGPRVMKIGTGGNLVLTSAYLTGTYEIWQMFYNKCVNNLVGFGGSTNASNDAQYIADTLISSSTAINFNGYNTGSATGGCYGNCNDVGCAVQDNTGDFYALISSKSNNSADHLQKSLMAFGYIPPLAFDVQTGYVFNEAFASTGYTNVLHTTRINALAVNLYYLYSFDGKTLKAWNKNSGTQLASVVVNNAYTGGESRSNEGIAVDECNNIYIGGQNRVYCYTFNGTTLTLSSTITTNISGNVRDIKLDKASKLLFIAGVGFVTIMQSANCIVNPLTISHTLFVANCLGSIDITVSGGVPPYTYNWSNGDNTSFITSLSPGTYVVLVSDNSCNINNIKDTIKIAPFQEITLAGDTEICANSSTFLSATGSTFYSWSPGGMITDSILVTPDTTTTYTCVGYFALCNDTVSIKVNVHPVLKVTPDSADICLGSSTKLIASGSSIYHWSPGGMITDTVIVTPLVSTTYTCIGNSAFCNDTVSVNVNVHSVMAVSPDSVDICKGATATLSATGQDYYFWYPGGMNGSSTMVSPLVTTTYLCVGHSDFCPDTLSIKVNVHPVLALPDSIDICIGDAAKVIATGSDIYSWNPGGFTNDTIIVAPIITTTYTCIGSSAYCTDTLSVKVKVHSILMMSTNPVDICKGDATTLTASGSDIYKWSPGGMTGDTIIVTPAITTTYTCIGSSPYCKDTLSIKVNVHSVLMLTPDSANICNGASTTLVATGSDNYSWSPGGMTSSTIVVTPNANTIYTCIGSSAFCTDTLSVNINVHPPPVISVDSAQVCRDLLATLTATGPANLTYKWTNGYVGNPLQVSTNTTTTYTVIATDAFGCKDTASGTVHIFPSPVAVFTATPRIATYDSPIITFTDHSIDAILWHWNFGDITSINDTSNLPSPIHSFEGIGEFTIWLKVDNDYGCSDSISETIIIENPEIIYIPNALDPTNKNTDIATFKARGIGIDANNYQMIIYDRWGQEVFKTGNPEEAWNGRFNNTGEVLTGGVYVYYIKVKFILAHEKVFSGKVVLVQ